MKTSNKLLLSFVGLIVLLMLLTDTVIWANYKRGRSGDGLLTDDDNHHVKANNIPVSAFKVLKIEGKTDDHLSIEKDGKYQITFWGDKDQQFNYLTQSDTMFIKLKEGDHFTLKCPVLPTVILSEGIGIDVRNFNQPALNILAKNYCRMQLFDVEINMLNVDGGEENQFSVMGVNTRIDSIYLKLGRSGKIRSYDIPYKHVSMDVDSLQELLLEGRSLTSMKQIK